MIALHLLSGCAAYSVGFELSSTITPLEVVVSPDVSLPVGIVATALAIATKNGEPVDADVTITLTPADIGVIELSPVAVTSENDPPNLWALAGVGAGVTELWPSVDGHDAPPIPVEVTVPPE
ncbi:MAG: hypothetical protein ABMB14_11630 [Myxococcota bacterium]